MSVECDLCERDLRGGHSNWCPRNPENIAAQMIIGGWTFRWQSDSRFVVATNPQVGQQSICEVMNIIQIDDFGRLIAALLTRQAAPPPGTQMRYAEACNLTVSRRRDSNDGNKEVIRVLRDREWLGNIVRLKSGQFCFVPIGIPMIPPMTLKGIAELVEAFRDSHIALEE